MSNLRVSVLCVRHRARAGIEGQLGGTIAYDWRPEGLIVAIRLPVGTLSR